LGQLLGLAVVVMGLSHTIARERLFEGLRARLGGPSSWLGYLVSCPYCVSHWVAFVLVPVTGTYPLDVAPSWGAARPVIRWFLSSILVATLAAFMRVAFYFVDESQGLVRRQRNVAQKEAEDRGFTEPPAKWRRFLPPLAPAGERSGLAVHGRAGAASLASADRRGSVRVGALVHGDAQRLDI
jgi:hypothetical protein